VLVEMQVDLVRPRDGAGIVLGEDFIRIFMKFLCFQIICNYEYFGLWIITMLFILMKFCLL